MMLWVAWAAAGDLLGGLLHVCGVMKFKFGHEGWDKERGGRGGEALCVEIVMLKFMAIAIPANICRMSGTAMC